MEDWEIRCFRNLVAKTWLRKRVEIKRISRTSVLLFGITITPSSWPIPFSVVRDRERLLQIEYTGAKSAVSRIYDFDQLSRLYELCCSSCSSISQYCGSETQC